MKNRGILVFFSLVLLSLASETWAQDDAKVVAKWKHLDGVITLYSNGKINDPAGNHTWTLTNRSLVLRWKDAKAPGGFWVDTVTISPDGQTYKGTNQLNRPISGTLVKDAPAAKEVEKPVVVAKPPLPVPDPGVKPSGPAVAVSEDVWKVLQLVSLDYELNFKKVPRDHSLPPYTPLIASKSAGVREVAALSAKWEIDVWDLQKAFKNRVGAVEGFLKVPTPRPANAQPDPVQPETPAAVTAALAQAKRDGLLELFTKIEERVPEVEKEDGKVGKMSQTSADYYRTQLIVAQKQAALWARAEALAKAAANGDNTRGNDIEVKGVFEKGKTWGTVIVRNTSKTDLEHVTVTLLTPKKALPPGAPVLDFILGYAVGGADKPDPKDPKKVAAGVNLVGAVAQDRAFHEMPGQVFIHIPKLAPGAECEVRLFRSSAEFAQTVSAMYSVFAPGVSIAGKPLPGFDAEKSNKTPTAESVADSKDPLPKGTIWRGPVKWTQAGTPDLTRTAEITITARNDDKFKGVLKFFGNGANGNASDIVGTVADGTIKYELVGSNGKTGLLHTGTIKGVRIEVTYEEGGDKPRKSVTTLDRVPPGKK
ncbi:MAG: hypothetical protein K8U57_29315 [Planctomycetes bacterium]|nr:hypothetical protein [Planctomycetota bacterium]